MSPRLGLVIAGVALAGCSLIYDPENLPRAGDAALDALIIVPDALDITGATPAQIFEGQGEGGSAPALVVIQGINIIDRNTVIEITSASRAVQLVLGTPVVASDGRWIAIPTRVPVDASLVQGESVVLDVKVTQELPPANGDAGGTTVSATKLGALTLVGLNELTAAPPVVIGTTIDTDALAALYSKIDLSGLASATLDGDQRAIFRAVSSIQLGNLTANGATGGPMGAPAKVGGCPGGGPASVGGCDSIVAGKGGTDGGLLGGAGGGGGGGFAIVGDTGTGNGAGGGGSQTGDAQILSFNGAGGRSPNRPGGGGGGGRAALALENGGGGGASGGIIEISAGGDLAVGTVTANGGAGQSIAGMTGGGGGAGGVVLLRADGALTSGALSVRGGTRGTGSNGNGGAGAPGRVRWDVPDGSAPAATAGSVHRGPAFTMTERVFRVPSAQVSLIATAGDAFDLTVASGGRIESGARVVVGPMGTATFPQELQPGHTQLCLTFAGAQPSSSEATECVDLAYIP